MRSATDEPASCADAYRSLAVMWLEPRLQAEISYPEMMQGRLRDRSCYQARSERRRRR
jgi:hypothetical protein